MALLRATCPHCRTESVLFQSIADHLIKGNDHSVFFKCNFCNNTIVAIVNVKGNYISPHNNMLDLDPSIYTIINTIPELPKLSAPANTPENISSYFIQAVDNLMREHYDASGAMFRKTLEATTKHLGETKGSLQNKIDALEEKRKITPDMKEWAHAIRLDGNDAVHDENPFNKKTCEALRLFTELFLLYLFTLPNMLEERKKVTATQ